MPLCLVVLAVVAAYVGVLSAQQVGRARRARVGSLYRPGAITVRAAHAHPAHAALPCGGCHGDGPDALAGIDAGQRPTKARCLPCHDGARVAAPTDATALPLDARAPCRSCHLTAVAPAVARTAAALGTPRRRPSIRFTHARHASAPCTGCHGGAPGGGAEGAAEGGAEGAAEGGAEGAAENAAVRPGADANGPEVALPSMARCLQCHVERGLGGRCADCHATRPDGRLVTDFGRAGVLAPRGPLLGMAHDRDWLVRHRWVGADHGDACASCHDEQDCEACHDAPRPPRRVHPGDFLSLHPQQSRRAPATCASCHTVQRFCAECHARMGLSLGAAPDVATTARIHPPASVWIRGPNRHAAAARRDLASCASCHAEPDCVACHGAPDVGGAGVSPHPPGFAGECRRLVRQNDRACRRCHGAAIPCP